MPLLIVCTARPELYDTRAGWSSGLGDATTLGLTPLSDADTARLVAGLLERAVLPAETQALLLERAGGNPLYAEEFVRMLRDRDLLDEHGGLRPDAQVTVPESIQPLIAARLDTLPQDRKRLLQDAAVIGKVFWAGSAAVMGGRDVGEAEEALRELARRELIRPARQSSMEGETEYGFWHALVRDVAYSQIPRAERADRHLKAADLARTQGRRPRRGPGRGARLPHRRGAHPRPSGRATPPSRPRSRPPPPASPSSQAQRAIGLDADKALQLLARARELTPDTDPRYPLVLLRWGDAAWQAGRFREADEALELAAASLEEQGDVVHAAEALSLLGFIRRRVAKPGFLELHERAVALLQPIPGPQLVASLAELVDGQMISGERRGCH